MGSWCSRGPRHKECRKCLGVAVPQRLMGTVKRGPVPSPWAGSEAEFYSVPQSFPVELDPSHPLRWPGLTGCLCPLCHLPARLPFRAQRTHSAPFLARGPRLPPSRRSATPSRLRQGVLLCDAAHPQAYPCPGLQKKGARGEGHPGERFPMRE